METPREVAELDLRMQFRERIPFTVYLLRRRVFLTLSFLYMILYALTGQVIMALGLCIGAGFISYTFFNKVLFYEIENTGEYVFFVNLYHLLREKLLWE